MQSSFPQIILNSIVARYQVTIQSTTNCSINEDKLKELLTLDLKSGAILAAVGNSPLSDWRLVLVWLVGVFQVGNLS